MHWVGVCWRTGFGRCAYLVGRNKAALCVRISLLSSICSKRKQDSNSSVPAICPRFSGTSLTLNLFLIFSSSTTRMFPIFQHFCVQMQPPIWFSHTRETLKHLSVVLSVLIFLQVFHPGSNDQHMMVRLGLHLSSGEACSSAEFGPGGLS